MAFDVNLDSLFDPMVLEPFTIQRRTESFGLNGRVVIANSSIPARGVIVAASPDELDRLESYQITGRAIKITASIPLQGEVQGFQPDVIIWRGTNYIVKTIDYFVQYGKGFYEALATSMDKNDVAFASVLPPQLIFNKSSNSQLSTLIGV